MMAAREMAVRVHPDDLVDATGLLNSQSLGCGGHGGDGSARGGAARMVRVNVRENVLDWLASRGMVTEQQQRAGERLRADFERAGLGAKVTMNWDAGPVAKSRSGARAGDASLARMDAHRRFSGAMDAVGAGLNDICWRVICGGEGMSAAERGLGWPARSGKLVLGMALDRLARFYGT